MITTYIVSFSGGKDSTALLLWAIDNYGKESLKVVFADTGAEFPETYEYLKYIEKELGLTIHHVKSYKWDFFSYCRHRKAFPDALVRFCTSDLKQAPLSKWITANADRKKDILLTGERRQESQRRAAYEEKYFNTKLRINGYRPLLSWTTFDVLNYIKDHGIELHPVYEHYTRLGCYCCIFNTTSEWLQLYKYYPELFEKVAALEEEIGYTVKQDESLRQLINRIYNPNQMELFKEG